uniref:SET domain-containing protein n=1 Tax=Chaetoceros debilis TaxID=122233 RepID=A0A7S3V5X7_9STRA
MSEDPFSCFGDDSDDDVQVDIEEINGGKTARLLVEQANERFATTNIIDRSAASKLRKPCTEVMHEPSRDLPQALDVPFEPPLYLGPIQVVRESKIGGNRGYVATQDLQPGTLLLVEAPAFQWPEEQIGEELGLVSIQAIFAHENAEMIMHEISFLYPTKDEVEDIIRKKKSADEISLDERLQIKDMMEIMEMQHGGSKELQLVLGMAQANGIHVDEIDIFRILLAMRYNGFGSGVYLHFAMFNHDDDCNCVKFVPDSSDDIKYCSEVRTTKFVSRGSPLSLHYLDPREASHASRRQHLWDQHRFDIGDAMNQVRDDLQEMELVNKVFPPSSRDVLDHDRVTYLVESTLKELEEQLGEIKLGWSLFSANPKIVSMDLKDEIAVLFERGKALEMAADEMCRATESKLENDSHLLLIRCCRLHLDSSEFLLEIGGALSPGLNTSQKMSIMLRFTKSSYMLLPIQTTYLGTDHPDIARTYYDLALSINGLLSSSSSNNLFELGIQEFSSFAKCQRIEAAYLREHKRIDSMYPKDVDQKLNKH